MVNQVKRDLHLSQFIYMAGPAMSALTRSGCVSQERNILDQCDYPGIARLYFTFQDEASLYLGLELCHNGVCSASLSDFSDATCLCASLAAVHLLAMNACPFATQCRRAKEFIACSHSLYIVAATVAYASSFHI